MDILNRIDTLITPHGLFAMGHLSEGDDSLILIGTNHGFWQIFPDTQEYNDTRADPLDRWSKRVLGAIAHQLGGRAVFPSDGPPYAPFISWAIKTGRFWQSPTGMLIHDTAGLMISIRAAIRLNGIQLPVNSKRDSSPCDTCKTKPCGTACPVKALNLVDFYDVPKCKTHLATLEGKTCMTHGCLVRQICPISRKFARPPAQSAFHMRAFMPNTETK